MSLTTALNLGQAGITLLQEFEAKRIKPLQVVITGCPIPISNPISSIGGLPVGWIKQERVGWIIEMIGEGFAYGSVIVRPGGSAETMWQVQRGWLPARVRDWVLATMLKDLNQRLYDGLEGGSSATR
jgi:hypothetical protein